MQTAVVRRSSFVKRISPASTCGWEESVMVDSGSPVNTTRELGGSPASILNAIHGSMNHFRIIDLAVNLDERRSSIQRFWPPARTRTKVHPYVMPVCVDRHTPTNMCSASRLILQDGRLNITLPYDRINNHFREV
jgi:hypothetical protein